MGFFCHSAYADITVTSTYQGWLSHFDGINNVPTNCHNMSAIGTDERGFVQNTSTGILFLTHENAEADCLRGFVFFDLTGVNTSTVTSAEIIAQGGTGSGATPDNITPNWNSTDSGDGNWAVFGWTPSSTASTVLTDYSSSTNGAVSSTFFSTASTSISWQLNVTNTIPLNSDALNFILNGHGTFVFRGSYDYNNAADNPVNHTNFIQGYNLRLHLITSSPPPPPSSSSSIEFAYPTSTSFLYPNFNAWVASTTGITPSSTGYIGVVYSKYFNYLTQAKIDMGNTISVPSDVLVTINYRKINTNVVKFSELTSSSYLFAWNSIDGLQNATWSAYMFLADGNRTITNYSNYLTFRVGTSTATYPTNSTTTNLAGPFGTIQNQSPWQPTVTTYSPQNTCLTNFASSSIFDPNTISQVVYCAWHDFTENIVDESQSKSALVLNQAVAVFKGVFPISLISAVNDDVTAAENSTSTNADIVIAAGTSTVFGGRQLAFLTASTTSWISENAKFDYKGFIEKMLYLLVGGYILFTSIKAFMKITHR